MFLFSRFNNGNNNSSGVLKDKCLLNNYSVPNIILIAFTQILLRIKQSQTFTPNNKDDQYQAITRCLHLSKYFTFTCSLSLTIAL